MPAIPVRPIPTLLVRCPNVVEGVAETQLASWREQREPHTVIANTQQAGTLAMDENETRELLEETLRAMLDREAERKRLADEIVELRALSVRLWLELEAEN